MPHGNGFIVAIRIYLFYYQNFHQRGIRPDSANAIHIRTNPQKCCYDYDALDKCSTDKPPHCHQREPSVINRLNMI